MYGESSDIQANSGVPASELYLDPYIEAEEEVVIASSGEDDETHETNCESSSIPAVSSPAPARLIGAVPLQNDGCFRTPQGFQKTATYPVDAMQGRVDDDYDDMGEEDLDAPSTSTAHLFKKSIKRDPDGSSISDEAPNAKRRVNGQGLYPLERLSIMIGPRLVRLKVVDIDPLNVISDEAEPHFVIHANEDAQAPRGAYKCDLCQRCFAMKRDWSHHMIQVHGMMKPFTCVICGVGFTSGTKLGAHLKTHNAGGKNCCKMCNKSFTRPQAYQLHMKLHEMGKHFCNVCGRSVRNSENLAAHQAACAAMATGELIHLDRPYRYQCNYCEKMFHHLRDKKTHERVHTGEKPYVCGYCGRGFSQSQALTIHIRIHTGERPYECKLCKKQFYDVSALRKHEYKMCVIVEPPPILQLECDMTEVVEEVIETQEMVQVVEEETVETSRMHDYEEPHDDYQPTDDDDSLLLDDDYKTGPC